MRRIALVFALASLLTPALAGETEKKDAKPTQAAAAPHLFDRFKALAGDWSATGLDGNSMPDLSLRYEVTASGNAVIETMAPGTPHEMKTVFMRDGDGVLLNHYCVSGNHPRMRAHQVEGDKITFSFDSAENFDPAKAGHMHDASFDFIGKDELRTQWNFWADGKPAKHVANVHVKRVAK